MFEQFALFAGLKRLAKNAESEVKTRQYDPKGGEYSSEMSHEIMSPRFVSASTTSSSFCHV
jgi:hypothetical protein